MKDPRTSLIAIDSNVFDTGSATHASDLDQFETLLRAGEFNLLVTESVWQEISDPNTPPHLAEKYRPHCRALPFQVTEEQQARRNLASAVLIGGGRPYRHNSDAKILAEAVESGAHYLITEDRRVLNKDLKLRAIYPEIDIRSLSELMKIFGEFKNGTRK
jgi:predicted nucleic acid-binding protein